jgi:hypothetical protein
VSDLTGLAGAPLVFSRSQFRHRPCRLRHRHLLEGHRGGGARRSTSGPGSYSMPCKWRCDAPGPGRPPAQPGPGASQRRRIAVHLGLLHCAPARGRHLHHRRCLRQRPDESTIGLYKTELIKPRGPWRSPDDVELATVEHTSGFTRRSVASHPPGTKPPTTLKPALADGWIQQLMPLRNSGSSTCAAQRWSCAAGSRPSP